MLRRAPDHIALQARGDYIPQFSGILDRVLQKAVAHLVDYYQHGRYRRKGEQQHQTRNNL